MERQHIKISLASKDVATIRRIIGAGDDARMHGISEYLSACVAENEGRWRAALRQLEAKGWTRTELGQALAQLSGAWLEEVLPPTDVERAVRAELERSAMFAAYARVSLTLDEAVAFECLARERWRRRNVQIDAALAA